MGGHGNMSKNGGSNENANTGVNVNVAAPPIQLLNQHFISNQRCALLKINKNFHEGDYETYVSEILKFTQDKGAIMFLFGNILTEDKDIIKGNKGNKIIKDVNTQTGGKRGKNKQRNGQKLQEYRVSKDKKLGVLIDHTKGDKLTYVKMESGKTENDTAYYIIEFKNRDSHLYRACILSYVDNKETYNGDVTNIEGKEKNGIDNIRVNFIFSGNRDVYKVTDKKISPMVKVKNGATGVYFRALKEAREKITKAQEKAAAEAEQNPEENTEAAAEQKAQENTEEYIIGFGNGNPFGIGNGNGNQEGGKRKRRTRKASKNRRKSMKAKKMRRKNKNKSSKGKKSKTSRRR